MESKRCFRQSGSMVAADSDCSSSHNPSRFCACSNMDRPWGKALMARPLLLPLHGLVAGDKEDQIGDPSKVHVKGQQWQTASLHLRQLGRDLGLTAISFNSAANAFSISAKWKQACHLLAICAGKSYEKDAVLSNSVISAFARRSRWVHAGDLLSWMTGSFVRCTQMTLSATMNACRNGCRNGARLQLWQGALVLLSEAPACSVQPDGVMHSSCICACETENQWQQALATFISCQAVRTQTVNAYNAAISACEKCSQWQQALAVFEILSHTQNVQPDVISYNAIISTSQDWTLALFFLESLLQGKLQPTLVTFNAALSTFDSGEWMEAIVLLEQLQSHRLLPDIITFHTLVRSSSKTHWQHAFYWLSELDTRYLQSDPITHSGVITACTHANHWQRSLLLGSEALAMPACDAHTCTDSIVACERGGRWQSALCFLQGLVNLAVEGDLVACNAAMSACASQGAWPQSLAGLHKLDPQEPAALTAYEIAVIACPARPDDAGSDEEDPELYEQLSKQRRLVKRADTGQAKKGEAALTQVSERIQGMGEEEDEVKEKEKELLGLKKDADSNVALTATTEFCNVVQTPLEKIETLKHESFRGSTLYKQQATQRKGVAAGERKARKAGLPEEVMAATKDAEEDLEQTLIEESLDLSCASGLEYLRARSQIGCDQDSHRIRKLDNRPLEMSTVDGDIKLEYRDDFGRVQTPKEAFRSISWKFHGKVPGRKNMERRLLRLENEMRLKSMNVIEALPTLRALRHAQTADAKPYMVLSGANEK
ncbi:unnamed protein product [Symbiodinium necroappetens]|uniref:Pentatricopeptide repeat-containing protein, chloroplastic n=1 Tax=Symbiodinium necroappetens TaxID=1628268 RepID=A0A813BLZ9_9DINO|nr:unnamed protein product [Symbiodinium necroappetens]